jgi:glycosyltransferase involved in cell wall biosynthesis
MPVLQKTMSSISVIIPCYNYARYLRGCVASVLDQPGVDVRVLVIDDCSKDETAEVGAALAREDSRITFRRHETNKGHIATYNEGIDWAEGDYFLLISADDLATPGALTRAAAVMDEHPNVVMTHGKFFRLKGDSTPERYHAPSTPAVKVTKGLDFFEQMCRAGENIVNTPTAIVRTRTQKRVGGYNPALPHAGDMEMWMRFAAHGDIAFIDAMQAHYRFHDANMHIAFYDQRMRDLEQKRLTYRSVFDSLGAQLPDLPRLRKLADEGLGREAFWHAATLFDQGQVEECERTLKFALALDPNLTGSDDFRKLQWKRRLGAKVWPLLMPLVRQLRRKQTAIL